MNWLGFSLCRTLFLIPVVVTISQVSHAGILEELSQAAKATHTLSTCPTYNKRDAHMALSQADVCVQANSQDLSKQGLDLSKIQKTIETNVEDRYFATLATQHSNELVCASQFAEKVQAGDVQAANVLKPLFRDLRTFKQALNEATENITKNPQVSLKVCPLSLADLKNDFPNEQSRDTDLNYVACAQLISARSSYQAVLSAIPLAQFPSTQAALNKYATSKADLSDAALDKLIQSTYKNAKTEILKQAQDIRDKAKSKGGSAFSRSDRHALLADPRLTEKVLTDSGNSEALKAVACTADARYGSGADDLDTGLFVGSMAVSGGLVIKAAGSAMKMATAANAGRALGVFSWNTSNIIRIAAIAGLQGTSAWNGIEKACFDNTVKMKATTAGSCSDAPSVEKLQQDNCVLAGALAAMEIAPGAAVAKLTDKQNKMAAALKGRALEAKIAARRAAIAERNAPSPTTSAASSSSVVAPLKVAPKKGVTVVQTDAAAPTTGGNVTSSSQLSAARAKKEQERTLAAKEKEAEEMRAAGVDEYDIHFKQMRDEELANLKSEGLYTTKAPTGTTFESGSLVKGGKGPFESKAGDLNLITEEQLKQLERHNPGTVVYNYKTGEELVIGLDDFDKDLMKLKIAGKYLQWGFKTTP